MSTKHTPGPWEARAVDSIGVLRVYANSGLVATPGHRNNEAEESANARLIAAAPELLEALRVAVLQNSHDMLMTGDELRFCEAAIAKATGSEA